QAAAGAVLHARPAAVPRRRPAARAPAAPVRGGHHRHGCAVDERLWPQRLGPDRAHVTAGLPQGVRHRRRPAADHRGGLDPAALSGAPWAQGTPCVQCGFMEHVAAIAAEETSPMKRLIISAVAALALAACATATPYQPLGPGSSGGGYSEQRLESDRYMVSFAGNSVT